MYILIIEQWSDKTGDNYGDTGNSERLRSHLHLIALNTPQVLDWLKLFEVTWKRERMSDLDGHDNTQKIHDTNPDIKYEIMIKISVMIKIMISNAIYDKTEWNTQRVSYGFDLFSDIYDKEYDKIWNSW